MKQKHQFTRIIKSVAILTGAIIMISLFILQWMPYTKRPKVTRNLQGEVRDEENEKSKSKVRTINDITIEYRLARDRVIWKTTKDVETIKSLKEKYKL